MGSTRAGSSADVGRMSVDVKQYLPSIGQIWAVSGSRWGSFRAPWPSWPVAPRRRLDNSDSYPCLRPRIRLRSDMLVCLRTRNVASMSETSDKLGPELAMFWPALAKFGRKPAQIDKYPVGPHRSNLIASGAIVAQIGQTVADHGQVWPKLGRFSSSEATVRQLLGDFRTIADLAGIAGAKL